MVSTRTMVMWRGFFLFGTLLVCQVLGANLGVAQSPRLATDWQGTYSYPSGDNRTPVAFTLHLSATGGSFTGRTTEPATFGNGSSSQLYANVSGNVSGNSISFTKTYDGTGGVNHSVNYRGSLSSDGSSMSGSWNIGNFGGSFRASAVGGQVSCLTPSRVFPKGDVTGTVLWHFGNSCGASRYVSVCADYGNGQVNRLGSDVPPSGATITLREGWAHLSWKEGGGDPCAN